MNTKIKPDFDYVYNEIVAGRILDIGFNLKRLHSGITSDHERRLIFTISQYALTICYYEPDMRKDITCWVKYFDPDNSQLAGYNILNEKINKLLAACEDFTGMPISEFTYGLVDYLEEK